MFWGFSCYFIAAFSFCSNTYQLSDASHVPDKSLTREDSGVKEEPSIKEKKEQKDPASYLFDDQALRTYEVTIAPSDFEKMNKTALQELYVPASLKFEGAVLSPIGVRYKGGDATLGLCFDDSGKRICPKLSIKLDFNEYKAGQKFFGLKHLVFNSNHWDHSLLHERLAYSLFREHGVIAPRAAHAKLYLNGVYAGIFTLVEQIDGQFTKRWFSDGGEGNLYKEICPNHKDENLFLSQLKTNEKKNPTAKRFARFAAQIMAADKQSFSKVLASWTDIDTLARLMAVDRLIENWDGPTMFYCTDPIEKTYENHNLYWYEERNADRVWLIPWDLDLTMEPDWIRDEYGFPEWDDPRRICEGVEIFEEQLALPAACDALFYGLAHYVRDRYVAAAQKLLDGPARVDLVLKKINQWKAQIQDAVASDPNGPKLEEWKAAVDALIRDYPKLREHLSRRIAEPL